MVSCNSKQTYKSNLLVFGTLTKITLHQVSSKQAQQTFSQIENYFNLVHTQWHSWLGDGMLMQINGAIKRGETIKIDQETQTLIELSKRINLQSNGLFDPAIGQLINLWGFNQLNDEWNYPNEAELKRLIKSKPSVQNIKIKNNFLSSTNTDVLLDFGGIAKGYAIKQAMLLIKNNGINNATINSGGDICVIGKKQNAAWNIAIRHPNKKSLLASVKLHSGECIMTSGGYERFVEHKGKRYSHIINPITGYPVNKVFSVSVIDTNAALADAAATAISLVPSNNWFTLKNKLKVNAIIALDENNQIIISESIQKRVTVLSPNENKR